MGKLVAVDHGAAEQPDAKIMLHAASGGYYYLVVGSPGWNLFPFTEHQRGLARDRVTQVRRTAARFLPAISNGSLKRAGYFWS